ncbi:hypothetical protein N9L02_01435 [Gammaproteobacteria bacterium]|nr:hypothetical protein [Gammaproteobacteria bacterium]
MFEFDGFNVKCLLAAMTLTSVISWCRLKIYRNQISQKNKVQAKIVTEIQSTMTIIEQQVEKIELGIKQLKLLLNNKELIFDRKLMKDFYLQVCIYQESNLDFSSKNKKVLLLADLLSNRNNNEKLIDSIEYIMVALNKQKTSGLVLSSKSSLFQTNDRLLTLSSSKLNQSSSVKINRKN